MRNLWVVLLVVVGCGGEAPDVGESPSDTWCCEVVAVDGNDRFSRFCGLTEEEAVSWMRNPDEVCWDDAL